MGHGKLKDAVPVQGRTHEDVVHVLELPRTVVIQDVRGIPAVGKSVQVHGTRRDTQTFARQADPDVDDGRLKDVAEPTDEVPTGLSEALGRVRGVRLENLGLLLESVASPPRVTNESAAHRRQLVDVLRSEASHDSVEPEVGGDAELVVDQVPGATGTVARGSGQLREARLLCSKKRKKTDKENVNEEKKKGTRDVVIFFPPLTLLSHEDIFFCLFLFDLLFLKKNFFFSSSLP